MQKSLGLPPNLFFDEIDVSEILLRLKNDRGNVDSVFSIPRVADQIEKVLAARQWLIITTSQELAQIFQAEGGVTVAIVSYYTLNQDFLPSIRVAPPCFDIVIVVLKEEEIFDWDNYTDLDDL